MLTTPYFIIHEPSCISCIPVSKTNIILLDFHVPCPPIKKQVILYTILNIAKLQLVHVVSIHHKPNEP